MALLICLAIIPWCASPGLAADADARTEVPKSLRAASELDYPPFALVNPDGSADGFSVELLRAAAEAAGASVSFKVGPWHAIKQELAERTLDVLPLVSYSRERDQIYDFTAPYLRLNGTVFVRRGTTGITRLADLAGKEVLVMRGDTAHEYAEKEHLTDMLIPTTSYEEAFTLLSQGLHDAVVVQQIVGLQLIKKLGLTNVVPVEVKDVATLKPVALKLEGFEQKFCFAVAEGNQQLLSLLNEGLAVIYLNGTYDALYEKWFAPILPKHTLSLKQYIRQLAVVIVPSLLLFTLLGIWYLKRLVNKRTLFLQQEIYRRKITEHELETANTQYLQAQRLSKIGSWEYDIASGLFTGSTEFHALFGFSGQAEGVTLEAVERCILQQQPFHDAFAALVHRGEAFNKEFDLKATDRQEQRTVVFLAQLTRDHAGVPLKVRGVLQDITERKQAEIALRESEERMRLAIASSPLPIIIYNEQGTVLQLSEGWTRLSGYDLADIPTIAAWTERAYGVERKDRVKEHIDTLFSIRQTVHNGEWTIVTKEGGRRVWEFQTTPLGRDSRSLRVLLSMAVDVTDRLQAEEEQKKLQTQLIQIQKLEAIGTLAGGIAHDFNNILSAILGYAEMALDDNPPGSPAAENIGQVITAGNRAKELVRQILAFSRQAESDRKPVQLATMIKETLKLLRPTLPTTIAIEQDIDADAALVHADPTHMHQIIMNLCTNAFHAMEKQGGILTLCLKNRVIRQQNLLDIHGVPPGPFVLLSVRDTGSGIPPEIRERIFHPYYTTKGAGKGSGMGLAIVHGIVKSHGGFITCQSLPGQGAEFIVALPALEREMEAAGKPAGAIPGGSERLLFVDDEPILVDMGKTMLERLGYTVTARTSSLKALALFQHQPEAFDLVITDQTMPGLTGIDLARQMLRIRPNIPIILCTGYSSLINEEMVRREGIRGFTLKPLTKKDLAGLIRTVLETGPA